MIGTILVVILACFLCVTDCRYHLLQNATVGTSNYADRSDGDSSFKEVGNVAVKMVEALSSGNEIDINGLSRLLQDLAKAAAFVDHPELIPKIETAASESNYLSEKIEKLESRMESKINDLYEENEKLKIAMTQQITVHNTSKVNFVAILPTAPSLREGQTIVCANIQNQGNGVYRNGEYSCPITGYYMISLTFQPRIRSPMMRHMMDSDRVTLAVYVKGKPQIMLTSGIGTTSGSTIAYCRAGDGIKIVSRGSGEIRENSAEFALSNRMQVHLINEV